MSGYGTLTSFLRKKVSGDRNRTDGIDASWIIPGRMLQMSTPGSSVYALWRNSQSDVLGFCQRHGIQTVLKCNVFDRYVTAAFEA